MKRLIHLILVLAIVSGNTAIGYTTPEDKRMESTIFDQYVYSDLIPLETAIHNEYPLENLVNFFDIGSSYKLIDENTKKLSISEVNNQFPIEIIRKNGYTVYKVTEGGYYYIFWARPVVTTEEPIVDFVAYISGNNELERFAHLRININDSKDVKSIDPSYELQRRLSRGIYSYSYLNQETLVQIQYSINSESKDQSLLISSITTIKRTDAPSYYRLILLDDLPK